MKETIIEKFVEKVTDGKSKNSVRFYEIFSARGFLLEVDNNSEIVRLSQESHIDDCEFLEVLQNINYKNIYKKPHFDSIEDDGDGEDAFPDINTHTLTISTHRLFRYK